MARASFRFYAELNDFLPARQRQRRFETVFDRRTSVKDMIEALGVPHPEVALIVVHAAPVDWDHIVADNDDIAVYPAFTALPCMPGVAGRADGTEPPRFVLDANLGALARRLRLCGIDASYRNDIDDGEIAALAAREDRVVLTRDRGVLKRRRVARGYFVRADAPDSQLEEVCRRFQLVDVLAPLSRCPRCNGQLQGVAKEAISHRLEPLTRQHFDIFRQCVACEQVYWRGSHVAGIERLVAKMRDGVGN